MSRRVRAHLDARGVAMPRLEDEAHVNGKTRTTYAAVDHGLGVLVVGIDNAAYRTKGYKGIARGERKFAEDMASYAQERGLTVVFAAHVPPNVTNAKKPDSHLPSPARAERTKEWMRQMQQKYPDSIWVHGHKHPQDNRLLDLDRRRDGREVSNLVLAGQARNSYTRIKTFEHGRSIREVKLEKVNGEWVRRPGPITYLSRDGKVVPDASTLGQPKGVLFSMSDVHRKDSYNAYYKAIQRDAERAQGNGLAVSYLDVGDHTVRPGRVPVELPGAERTYFVAGNHDYYNHSSLAGVVDKLLPLESDVELVVDYVRGTD